MESILQGLTALYAECQNRGAATMGALLTIMIEGAKYMDTLWTVERREYSSLKDRVKDLEQVTGTAPGSSADGHVVYPNEPSDHDLFVAGTDMGSNNGAAGGFASTYVTANAEDTTGIGASATAGLLNLTTGDRQLVRSHAIHFGTSGTMPTALTPSASVRLGSVTFPQAFSRPPKITLTPLTSRAASMNIHLNVYSNGSGYDVIADLGTFVTGNSYDYAVTVIPN